MPSTEDKSTIAQELIECLGDAIAKVCHQSETQDELLYYQQELDVFISGLLAEKQDANYALKPVLTIHNEIQLSQLRSIIIAIDSQNIVVKAEGSQLLFLERITTE
jgi:hypothetical protein